MIHEEEMSQQEQDSRDKVVEKACDWESSRREKASARGPAKERARYRHLLDGNALAEAVEKYRKSEGRER